MTDEKKEDRRFQLELLRFQMTLEVTLGLFVGILAGEYTLVAYYGTIKENTPQFIISLLILITTVIFYIEYKRRTEKELQR